MVSIQYFFQIFLKNLNFLTVPLERFCDNKNLFFENARHKINLIITFFKNEKTWILRNILWLAFISLKELDFKKHYMVSIY